MKKVEVEGHIETCRVGLVTTLVYPVIFGQDWRWFGELQQLWKKDPPSPTEAD